MTTIKSVQREIQPWHLRLPEEMGRYVGVLGRNEFETIAYKMVAVAKPAGEWIPLRYEHFSLNEQWTLDEMMMSGFLRYDIKEDSFLLTQRALQLIMEEYSGLH